MKADLIIKNAKIFTSNKENPLAGALAVKDGKFVYAGDEAGLADFEGSIEAGKDADFLVFDKDLLTAEKVGFSYYKPEYVYFGGKKVN